MKNGTCELCGEWAGQLLDGVCMPCVRRLVQPWTAVEIAEPVPAYTLELAARVREILAEALEVVPPPDIVEHIICEALFQAAGDAKSGRAVQLEYLGELSLVGDAGVILVPDDYLVPRQPTEVAAT